MDVTRAIDRVIVRIENSRGIKRWLLRLWKRWLERYIP